MNKEKNQTDKEKEVWFSRNEDMFFSVEMWYCAHKINDEDLLKNKVSYIITYILQAKMNRLALFN